MCIIKQWYFEGALALEFIWAVSSPRKQGPAIDLILASDRFYRPGPRDPKSPSFGFQIVSISCQYVQ